MVRREPARGNDAVNVGMQEQVLSPGVQDADDTDLGSQVLRIDGDFQQRLCAGSEQQIVKQARVLQSQHIQFVRYGEDHVEVAGGQEFAFPCRQPALARLCLTLGAVAIAARVVGDGLITATRASIAMPAEGGSAAALNGTKGFELLIIKARSIPIQETIALHAENVGHLEGGPSHSLSFRLKRAADVLAAGQSERIQRVGDRLQMPLRQVQVLSGGLQIAMSQQDLDGAQVGACFQQVGGPTVTQRMRRNAFVDASPARGFATGNPDGLVRNRLIQPAPRVRVGNR